MFQVLVNTDVTCFSADARVIRNFTTSSDSGLCRRRAQWRPVYCRTRRTDRLGPPLALRTVSSRTPHTRDQRPNSALLRYQHHDRHYSKRYVQTPLLSQRRYASVLEKKTHNRGGHLSTLFTYDITECRQGRPPLGFRSRGGTLLPFPSLPFP